MAGTKKTSKAFTQKEVDRIRKALADSKSKTRDLALFNTGISTMLRTSDLLALKVSDVMDEDFKMKSSFTVKMQKTSRNVSVQLCENSRLSLEAWIEASGKKRSDYLFTGGNRSNAGQPISTIQHWRLVKEWCKIAGVGLEDRSTHSLRKTKASIIYKKTHGNLEVVRQALGHTDLRNTATYLSIGEEEVLKVLEDVKV